MISHQGFLRLSLVCVLSWTALFGIVLELQDSESQYPEQAVIFGVVHHIYYDESTDTGEMIVSCGADELTIRIENLSPLLEPGSTILVQCELFEDDLPLLKQVIG